jgi:hypothetical protein
MDLIAPSYCREAMRQAYDADRPQWKDAPDAPGIWVGIGPTGGIDVYSLPRHSIPLPDYWSDDGSRYFGPIPGDEK